MDRHQQRMYCIVLRHLSGIQKGIQSAHAIIEYSNFFFRSKEYKRWARKDKTLIVLEVNSSQELEGILRELRELNHPIKEFIEPDINNSITTIAFLLNERIWDTETFLEERNVKILRLRELILTLRLASN